MNLPHHREKILEYIFKFNENKDVNPITNRLLSKYSVARGHLNKLDKKYKQVLLKSLEIDEHDIQKVVQEKNNLNPEENKNLNQLEKIYFKNVWYNVGDLKKEILLFKNIKKFNSLNIEEYVLSFHETRSINPITKFEMQEDGIAYKNLSRKSQ